MAVVVTFSTIWKCVRDITCSRFEVVRAFATFLHILDKRTWLLGQAYFLVSPCYDKGCVWLCWSFCFLVLARSANYSFLLAMWILLASWMMGTAQSQAYFLLLSDAWQSASCETPLHFMFFRFKFIFTFKIWQNYCCARHHGTSGRTLSHSLN